MASGGDIVGVVGAERTEAGELELLVEWEAGQPPLRLPVAAARRLWPRHCLDFFQNNLILPPAAPAPPAAPLASAKPSGQATAPTDGPKVEPKEEPAPVETDHTAAKEPTPQLAQEAQSTGDRPGPSGPKKRVRKRPCPEPDTDEEDEEEEMGELDGEDSGDSDFEGSDSESDEEGLGEGHRGLTKGTPEEAKGDGKEEEGELAWSAKVMVVMKSCEGPGKTLGLNRLTLVDRLRKRYQLDVFDYQLSSRIAGALVWMLHQKALKVAPNGSYPDGPFLLGPGSETMPLRRKPKRDAGRLRGKQQLVLWPLVSAALEKAPGGLGSKALHDRIQAKLRGWREQPEGGRRNSTVLACRLQTHLLQKLAMGMLELAGDSLKDGLIRLGPADLRAKAAGTAALVRQAAAALDCPKGFGAKEVVERLTERFGEVAETEEGRVKNSIGHLLSAGFLRRLSLGCYRLAH